MQQQQPQVVQYSQGPQPMAVVQGVPVAVQQPQQQVVVVQSTSRGWQYGLCDCDTPGSCSMCCMGWCCPCVRFAASAHHVMGWNYFMVIAVYTFIYMFELILTSIPEVGSYLSLLLSITLLVGRTLFRGKLREKYEIDGSGCEDCLLSACCGCCALIQEGKVADTKNNKQNEDNLRACDFGAPEATVAPAPTVIAGPPMVMNYMQPQYGQQQQPQYGQQQQPQYGQQQQPQYGQQQPPQYGQQQQPQYGQQQQPQYGQQQQPQYGQQQQPQYMPQQPGYDPNQPPPAAVPFHVAEPPKSTM